jgi:hypothetical protein
MRSSGNFSPEWGYLAPAPSFMRTARMVVVATAIGATAGAVVVLTLIERPSNESHAAVAARAIVTSVQAATPPAVQRAVTTAVQAPPVAPAQAASPAPAVPVTASTATTPPAEQPVSVSVAPAPQEPPSVTASTEQPAAAETAPVAAPDDAAAPPPEPVPPKKQAAPRKGGYAANDRVKPQPTIGTVLQHLFTAHAGNNYPNR